MSFVHLQVKSAYSLLSSAVSLEKLVERAKKHQYTAIALTDVHVLYGTIAFYKLCKKHQIKPIIGLTVSIQIKGNSFPFVLLAKNDIGYKHLLKLSSFMQTKYENGIPLSLFKTYSRGLFMLTPGLSGIIETFLLEGKDEEAYKVAQYFRQIVEKDSFYISIQRLGNKEEQYVHEKLMKLSNDLYIPLVATNDVVYVDKTDAFAYDCLTAIKNGTKVEENEKCSTERYFKNEASMQALFHDLPEAIVNANRIAEQCNVNLTLGKPSLPKFPVPNGIDKDQYLERLCFEGLKRRIEHPTDAYYNRLLYEIEVIKKMKFSDYFLIVSDFMHYAREMGIVTGPGRGSAAGSLVAYVLYITDVDPIAYNLLFERFLNPERISMPDIDIDFPDTRRDEIIHYVANKYGKSHVAQIITFGTLAAKAAIRDVAKVLGASQKEADSLARLIPSKPGITLKEALDESTLLQEKIAQSNVARKIFETALKVEGLPRHSSTHAAGVVISEQPLVDMVPIQQGHNGVYLTQFSMDYLEDVGLLKMDFLGLRNLTLIENVKELIERYEGKRISFDQIHYDDPKTLALLAEGDTTGVFQLESEGMRKVLRRLSPSSLEDIVAVNALYRPGPMENIPLFIDRKHGRKPVEYPHEDLQNILSTTHGVVVYQEQIMEIASTMAGFSLGEADLLRRAVGKKIKEILEREREHFVQGCLKKGYEENTANKVYDLIVKFANYGFNRSHAVAYSMISFQMAYLKAHYPLYFMAALLTSVSGNETKLSHYFRECKRKGMLILPPSINKSGYTFLIEKGAIRYSLASIKNVGNSALKEIFKERKKKPFTDLFDFCVRVSSKAVNRRTLESFIFSGAFDEFAKDRATLLASVDVALDHAELLKIEDGENQFDLFLQEELTIKPKYVEVETMPIHKKLQYEKEVIGFYFSNHPVDIYRDVMKANGTIPLVDCFKWIERKIKVGVYITNVKPIRTKKGETMAFLTISDASGEMEAVIFPNDYAKYSDKIKIGSIVFIQGKVDRRRERMQIIIQSVEDLKHLEQDHKGRLFIKLEGDVQQADSIQGIKKILRAYKGSYPVYIYYAQLKKTVQLQTDYWVNPTADCLKSLKGIVGERNVVLKE
ncbi:DNA polymerase III subunit alpha [Bacillus sp. FJAT-47783]|uniref:DNA polymerase III subunit alpha n=1 Tax=Bacillus sp. FJAT-47783 TaxID=2922712 RepID=UPI001FABFC92|nr:DNA polymerase III subunit alpha [Bacillus sp. FJAT-47783]